MEERDGSEETDEVAKLEKDFEEVGIDDFDYFNAEPQKRIRKAQGSRCR